MIQAIIGVPGLPWLHFRAIADTLMIPVTRVRKNSPVVTFAPPATRFVGEFNLVYVSEPSLVVKNKQLFSRPDLVSYVVVSGSETSLRDVGIPVRPHFSVPEFIAGLTSKEDPLAINLSRTRMEDVLFEQLTKGSLLGDLHTLFYRIPDARTRERLRVAVYGYLSGLRAKKPKTGIKPIDDLLNSESLPAFIEACKSVANGESSPHDYPDLDPFEITYTLKKSGSL